MIAKLTVHAPDRDAALTELARALNRSAIAGVETNRTFLSALVSNDDFGRMKVHTHWIDAHLDELVIPPTDPRARLWEAIAAVLYLMQDRSENGSDPWRNRDVFTGWRLGLGETLVEAGQRITLARPGKTGIELRITPIRQGGRFIVVDPDDTPVPLSLIEIDPQRWQITSMGESLTVDAHIQGEIIEIRTAEECHIFKAAPPLAFAAGDAGADRILTSPLTGMIIKVLVSDGDEVQAGDTVAILESMKLEISIKAAVSGRARNISITEGVMVDRGQVLVEIVEIETVDA
jgi:3-methylcrotonyl-CoA carboxylase alpha subunit